MKGHLLPRGPTAVRLFTTGATLGPLVDSLHNQCLLKYDIAPIALAWPEYLHPMASTGISSNIVDGSSSYLLCTSWLVPPLLGFAYVILGAILPRAISMLVPQSNKEKGSFTSSTNNEKASSNQQFFQKRAIQAVLSTALIIKLSEHHCFLHHVFAQYSK